MVHVLNVTHYVEASSVLIVVLRCERLQGPRDDGRSRTGCVVQTQLTTVTKHVLLAVRADTRIYIYIDCYIYIYITVM